MKQQTLKAAFKKGGSENKDKDTKKQEHTSKSPPAAVVSPNRDESEAKRKHISAASDEMDIDQPQKTEQKVEDPDQDMGQEVGNEVKLNASKKRGKGVEEKPHRDGIVESGDEEEDNEGESAGESRGLSYRGSK